MDVDKILDGNQLFLIAGPCVIESEEICFTVAEKVKELSEKYEISAIFKSSYVKANRTSMDSFSGHGTDFGLKKCSIMTKPSFLVFMIGSTLLPE